MGSIGTACGARDRIRHALMLALMVTSPQARFGCWSEMIANYAFTPSMQSLGL